MSRWACAAMFAVGCGHAAPPAPPPGSTHVAHGAVSDAQAPIDAPLGLEDDLPRLADRAVKLFQAWQAVVVADDTCAAAAGRLNQLAVEFADVIEANARIAHAGHDKIKALRAELEKHEDEMDAAAKGIVESKLMSKCASDPEFARAIDRVGGMP